VAYSAKLTGKDFSHSLNKIESVGLKRLVLVPESDIKLTRLKVFTCLHFFIPHHGGQNSWHR